MGAANDLATLQKTKCKNLPALCAGTRWSKKQRVLVPHRFGRKNVGSEPSVDAQRRRRSRLGAGVLSSSECLFFVFCSSSPPPSVGLFSICSVKFPQLFCSFHRKYEGLLKVLVTTQRAAGATKRYFQGSAVCRKTTQCLTINLHPVNTTVLQRLPDVD